MSVDLEAIAQRGRCDVTSLRLAIPLLEQGYSPPFLARYRRDELGGLDESSLWALWTAIQTEHEVQLRRDELVEAWQQTSLSDPAIGNAIKKSNSLRMLNRLGRRLKHETGEAADDAMRLAVRVLNPRKEDGADLSEIAAQVEGISDVDAAIGKVDVALAKRLAGDPRMVAAAVRWLAKNAKIQIASIHDPHVNAEDGSGDDESTADIEVKGEQPASPAPNQDAVAAQDGVEPSADAAAETSPTETLVEGTPAVGTVVETSLAEPTTPETAATEAATTETAAEPTASEPPGAVQEQVGPPEGADDANAALSMAVEVNAVEVNAVEVNGAAGATAEPADVEKRPGKGKKKSKAAAAKQAGKKQKKISPRQRRRRWLVGVLKPLEGKRLASDKLSAFQIVMLGRALRSQVAQCSFEYDATKLVSELQRTAGSINRNFEPQLRDIVLENEADIREAAEAAWWDDLHEKASARLVTITADHLRRHVNRGAVEAKVVMAIDAVGPRTAATSIVCADGRILHNEDLPCQLSSSLRSQAVARMGELIHSFHVDLIVISNGPARRATMIALGDLIAQSPEKSVRWTLSDRSGADVYASSSVADDEMRSTPRRFRAAAWLAFSILQPAQALAKIDPLKLRLSSFQRELADDALSGALEDVIVSGASRGGVDVNSAPVSWLVRLPGVNPEVARAIDQARRNSLFVTRSAVSDLPEWASVSGSRQALPFLRVFCSGEPLDGTLIHPDDYALAKKLANALEIELPPAAPPGYAPPDFSEPQDPTAKVKIAEAPSQAKPIVVEDFSNAGDRAREFSIDSTPTDAASQGEPASETAGDAVVAASDALAAAEGDATVQVDSSHAAAVEEPAAESEAGDESQPTSETESDGESKAENGDQAPVPTPPAMAREDIPEPIRRPRPERAKVEKCVKEWQIGSRRAHQLVQWLCDPFGDSDSSGSAPAVLDKIPSAKGLSEGDMVIGVVVGVMPFGVFVELAPDCSGLIHVSRVSDSYVEDLHEAVQVGDVITAWVTGLDDKRRRVALTAISPEREAELAEARSRSREQRSQPSGPRRGGRSDRAPARSGSGTANVATAQSGGDQARAAGPSRGGQSRGGQSSGGQSSGGQSSGGQSSGGQSRGGQSRGGQGGGSGRGSQGRDDSQSRGGRGGRGQRDNRAGGRGREKAPESYRVVSKAEAKPLTDAMQKGEEPLRSFGDLLQFFDKTTSSKPVPESKPNRPSAADQSPEGNESPNAEASGETKAAADTAKTAASNQNTQPAVDKQAESEAGRSTAASVQSDSAPESPATPPSSDEPSASVDTPSS